MKVTYDPPPAQRGPLARGAQDAMEVMLIFLVALLLFWRN